MDVNWPSRRATVAFTVVALISLVGAGWFNDDEPSWPAAVIAGVGVYIYFPRLSRRGGRTDDSSAAPSHRS
jgi:hypothetical protein